MLTCDNPNPLLSNSNQKKLARIDLQVTSFDESHIKKVNNVNDIYSIESNTSGFFRLIYPANSISEAKLSKCTGSGGRDIMKPSKGELGDFYLRIEFPNPIDGTTEKVVTKLNPQ